MTMPSTSTRATPSPQMDRRRVLTQKGRVVVGGLYLAGYLGVALAVSGLPDLGAGGAWFWAGALLIVLSTALTEPFFPTPGDAVANGAAAVLGAAAYPTGAVTAGALGASTEALGAGRAAVMAYGAIVVVMALVVIGVRDQPGSPKNNRRWVVFLRSLLSAVGSARSVYSVVFLAAVLAAFSDDVTALAVIAAMWLLIVEVRPLEWLHRRWPGSPPPPADAAVATVVSLRNPSLVELQASSAIAAGDVVTTGVSTLEVIDTARSSAGVWVLASVVSGPMPGLGDPASHGGRAAWPALGYVDTGTNLEQLVFAVPAALEELTYGDLVTANYGGVDVLYQVVGAEVRSTSIEPSVHHSKVVVTGVKLGGWDPGRTRFVPTQWLPTAGSPVRRLPAVAEPLSATAIGHVPGTAFAIEAHVDVLITHGTAVLGVLGSGKSTLARELMLRAVYEGAKVLVIDTCAEHAIELSDFIGPSSSPDDIAKAVNIKTEVALRATAGDVNAGGNRKIFAEAVTTDLRDFLCGDEQIRVYDITKFLVTKQTSWKDRNTGEADHSACTLPEITSIISTAIFELAKQRPDGQPRIWVVLEEGHQLVPEFGSISAKDDDKAVQRTTKAFLQGRKFGLGALVITQRTANVSKSLLTQCNTIFCFRAHDDSTSTFLRDRAGAAHVAALPNLLDRRVLAFGRGLAEDPLFLRVNDPVAIRKALADQAKLIDLEDLPVGPTEIPDTARSALAAPVPAK